MAYLTEESLLLFFDKAAIAVHCIDAEGTIRYANSAETKMLGYGLNEYVGRNIKDFHIDSTEIEEILQKLINNERVINTEVRLKTKDGGIKHVLINSSGSYRHGELLYSCCFTTDISETRRAERHLEILNLASSELITAGSIKTALEKISNLLIAKFCDFFAVEVLKHGNIELLSLKHKNPDTEAKAIQWRKNLPLPVRYSVIAEVTRTAREIFVPKISPATLGMTIDQEYQKFLPVTDLQSVISLPLSTKTQILGAITFISSPHRPLFDEKDLSLARNLTFRIAQALENVKLIEEKASEIKERHAVEVKLKETEKNFKSSLSFGLAGVWTSDLQKGIIYPDEYITRLFELEPSVEGFPITFLETRIHPEDQKKAAQSREEAIKEHRDYYCEFRILTANGKTRWVLARGFTEYSNSEVPISTSGILLDITDRKELESQKDEFLSIASHEIKTPLTNIKAYLQLLERSLLKEQGVPNLFLKKSQEQLEKLKRLTLDLLDASKISAGKMNYDMAVFDFADVITEVSDNKAFSREGELVVKNIVSIPIKGDKHRLEQVLNNLLSNAYKYSPDSKRVILNSSIENNCIVVSVQDFGIGIEQDELNKLFNRFYRIDNTAMKFEGMGLGLFIASEIIKKHHGTFWVESKIGEGSTFFFSLPLTEKNTEIL